MRNRVQTLVVALMLGASPAWSQSLEISPVSVEMDAPQRATVLSVINHGRTPVLIQVRPFAWRQNNGIDQLAPTDELAVSPPFVQLAPEQAQTVRVVSRRAADSGENSYRLLVDELPPPAEPGAVRFALRLSLPVFIKSEQPGTATLDWQLALLSSGPALVVRNSGRRHVKFTRFEVLVDNRRIPVGMGGHPYVLAGSVMEWPVSDHGWIRRGGTARLQAESNVGPVEATMPITTGP